MRKKTLRRLTAFLLSSAMVLSGIPAYAASTSSTDAAIVEESENTSVEEGKTSYGEEETTSVSTGSSQREQNFNGGWKFYLGNNSSASSVSFDDSGWTDVTLPHDFSITQTFTTSGEAESGFLPGGTSWYRKSFTMPEGDKGKSVVLSFDGVYSDAYVYVNGKQVGENHYGYNAFAFDISDELTYDGTTKNVIAVRAVNNIPTSRWYSGSGIYRDVKLLVTDPVHVAYNGTQVTTPNISSGSGDVKVQVEVENNGENNASVTVKNTVYTSNGTKASDEAEASATVSAGSTGSITSTPSVNSPSLWSTEHPNMYYVLTQIYVDGTLTDTYTTDFGFRWFSFSESGFTLNGQAMKLNGVCLHHDQGAAGSAAYYDAMYRQLSRMKDMGVNAIRTSHNMADEDLIDICDKLGLLVMEEAFDCWTNSKNGNSNDFSKYFNASLGSGNNLIGGSSSMTWAEFAIKSMVKRDRNDPAVIVWSLGNELDLSSNYPTIEQNLINWIKELDTTRTYTYGDNKWQTSTSTTAGQMLQVLKNNGGIAGFNYANSASSLSNLHSAWGPMISTETSSAINSRSIYTTTNGNDGKLHLSSYDNYAVSWGITAHESLWNTLRNDYIAGEFVWTGWDYIGEPTPWNGTGTGSVSGSGAVPNSSYFGMVDTAGFPKDTYYLYRSQWKQDDTTLHLVTAWDSDNMYTSSGKTPVVVYSNAPKVELYRNGTRIGTATRKVNTTNAGHEYYTYTVQSNNSSICTASNGSGSTSLYATFNVAYQAGSISAKAYDESGNEITKTVGNSVVSTPGTVAKLSVVPNTNSIKADGQSLAYIEVEVQDANGNVDTTATNTINFSLSGDGEIVGVDNGDQATTAKYQQSSVLSSRKSAHIAAYGGKALVIVKSTESAGSIDVNVSSSGLTGGSASIKTTAVESQDENVHLTSYTMVRDYSVPVGTKPELKTTAKGTLSDGSSIDGTITWDDISEDTYNTAGDYTVSGKLKFEGYDEITVIARLHVVADVIALRNVSTTTAKGTAPQLPSSVKGVLADGTLSGDFEVTWEDVDASQFGTVGDVITVNGRAKVIGDQKLPVTCTVRVTKGNSESTNVGPDATVTQDIDTAYQSDNLAAVNDGNKTFADNTSTRWTNYNNRTRSATATLTFTWEDAQKLSGANLYWYVDHWCAALPDSVEFQYSLNGTDFQTVEYTSETVQTASLGEEDAYTFKNAVQAKVIRVVITQQGGTSGSSCVGLLEAEMMTKAESADVNSSAALSSISVDGTAISDFVSENYSYSASGSEVTAETTVNAGITILPAYENVVRILTVSEDGENAHVYEVTLNGGTPTTDCKHEHTHVINQKDATCTEEGYTGDTYCDDCGKVIKEGEVIPAKGHTTEVQGYVEPTCTEFGYTGDEVCTVCGETVKKGEELPYRTHLTILRGYKAATCSETGYTGDRVCVNCGETITKGEEIPTIDHTWDDGVVTKEASTSEEGSILYTCTVCGATKTESIPKVEHEEGTELKVPEVTLSVRQNGRRIYMTGKETSGNGYYPVKVRGFVYMPRVQLGNRELTVKTQGRNRVTVNKVSGTGEFNYNFKHWFYISSYIIRAFVEYEDADGNLVYVYSDPVGNEDSQSTSGAKTNPFQNWSEDSEDSSTFATWEPISEESETAATASDIEE